MATRSSKKASAPAIDAASRWEQVKSRASQVLAGSPGGTAIQTPRGDMVIVNIGNAKTVNAAPKDQRATYLLPKVGKALAKPGVSREEVFGRLVAGQQVYAY
ncbi:MAG TPA: hypothetical protein VLJ58_14020 [Ramlibacter sp.]|nr:hypothetical protein [Ramlibacter sp.]